jgi:hypothetical protein
MERLLIFTNNPKVNEAYPDFARYIDGGICAIYTAVRDAVHQNARIVSHPQSGSFDPRENPYKSIALTQSGKLDFPSLHMIENAIHTLADCGGIFQKFDSDESVWEDYRIIDLDLIKNAMEANAWYTTSLS